MHGGQLLQAAAGCPPASRQLFTLLPRCAPCNPRQMYRYTDRVIAGPELKDQLKQWLQHGYSQGAGEAVPPPAAALDWLLKGLQAKVAHLRHALETQVGGGGLGGMPVGRLWAG